jgi:protein O-GlcNAc transferase
MAMEEPTKKQADKSDSVIQALLDDAQQLYTSGDMAQAESICRKVLTCWPGQAEALHLSGIIAHRSGRSKEAVALLRQALETMPSDLNVIKNLILILKELGRMEIAVSYCPQALSTGSDNYRTYKGLGDLFCSHGYLEEAAVLYEKVLAIKSDFGPVMSKLGNVLQALDRLDESIVCYQKALPLDPGNDELYYNLGNAFGKKQLFDEAVSNYEKALVLNPHHARAYFNMGNASKAVGRLDAAIGCYEKCIQFDGNDVDAHYNLANARYADGQMQAAVNAFEETLRRRPDDVLALNNLGCLSKDLGADEQAVAMFKRSIEIDPTYTPAYINLGNAYKDHHDFEHAYAAYRKAISLEPGNQDALVSMGSLLKKEGRFDEGLEFLKQAVGLCPDVSNAWWYYFLALPILYDSESDISTSRKRFSDGLTTLISAVKVDTSDQRKRALAGIGSITNFYLQYQGQNDLDLQKRYGRFVHRVMAANFPQYTVARQMPALNGDRKIKIGYLSSFMRAHTVGHFLMGWLENHDRSKFELYCYHIGHATDELTEAFKQKSDRFYQVPGNIEAMAKQVFNDDLHILTFTDIGMFAPATQLAGLRLAPIQCKGWGHPVTTGLPTIDYYLSADLMETDDADDHYSEKLVRLPNLALALKEPQVPENGKTRLDFGISGSDFVFLTSQSLFKYLPQYDDIYPRIAAGVENARFVFISNPSAGITQRFRKRIERAFNHHHLPMDRFCIFQPRLSPDDFMRLNKASDVLLDPFCWSGGKTTLEGIACGLPVVTCPGTFMRGRHAVAMLKMMGITETIAENAEAYIAIACRLGNDMDFFNRIRNSIAANRHLLYDDKSCIRALEDFYRRVVEGHQAELEKTTIE